MEILIIVVGVALFEMAVLVWGKDSRYSVNDPEWGRRRVWRGFISR